MQRDLLSVKEACNHIGISQATLYRRIGKGELRAVKCGRRTFIRKDDADNWIDSFPAIEPHAA